jgi:hypothetical protein
MAENWLASLTQIWLVKLLILWVAIDIITIATGWYGVKVIRQRFPNWWKNNIADIAPPELDYLHQTDAETGCFSVEPYSNIVNSTN